MALEHRLLIYVFRRPGAGDVQYLFERRRPREEFGWAPLHAEVGITETLRSAAMRSMRGLWHAPRPERWVELNVCGHQSVGDLDLIDWGVGYEVATGWDPAVGEPAAGVDIAWRSLPLALHMLDEEGARRALVRLHIEAAS